MIAQPVAVITAASQGHRRRLVDHPNSAVPAAVASLTKGGLNAVTKEVAIQYANHGIRCNAVALGDIDDAVGAVLYLENAPFVTGEVLDVDGGQSAGH